MPKIVHVEMLSNDPDRLMRFYEEALGWSMKPAFEPEPGAETSPEMDYWLATTGDPRHFGIDGAFMRRQFDQAVIHTIGVESLEETIGRVQKAGGTLIHGPNHIPGVGDHAYFKDPDGTIFGVIQPLMGEVGQGAEGNPND